MNKRILYRCRPDGWISLIQNTVTTMTDNVRQTVELQTEDQVQDLLQQAFGLTVKPL